MSLKLNVMMDHLFKSLDFVILSPKRYIFIASFNLNSDYLRVGKSVKTGKTSGECVKGDPHTAPTDGALRARALALPRCAVRPAASTGQEAGDRQRLVGESHLRVSGSLSVLLRF